MTQRPDSNGPGRRPVAGRPVPKNLGDSGRPKGPRNFGPAEDEDDFVPPNPKNPLASSRPAIVLGWGMVIIGIIALVSVPFIPIDWPSLLAPWIVPGLIALVIIGLIVLFLQMPSKRSGSGNGAQL
ncbi:DUF2207 domain-containing protein [Nesterenkonia sp. NBAIMH1]|uniref:DUF2207 domain-containing protein n=1 Tax=Nesterenkonia sp. NBAIMH1 TaxID=2600320 RepID=UPI0011B3FCD2|nr:DUF2207 domain-containing protein [Nesterenkonia sp. NBAIMH1]